jgi:hypothetical protein
MKKRRNVIIGALLAGLLLILTTGCNLMGTNIEFKTVEQTGGTAGVSDSTSLTLTFDVDPGSLTVDDIWLTGATKGALSGSGTKRSLAISDITVANGETVLVAVTSPAGCTIRGFPLAAVVYRESIIGSAYDGGIISYLFQSGDSGWVEGETHGLVAAAEDQSTVIAWITGGSTQSTFNGGTSTLIATGQANTAAMMGQTGYEGGAAKVCYDYTNIEDGTGVFSDWYLPSKDELNKMYINLKSENVGGFSDENYWSSSEQITTTAFAQSFGSGIQDSTTKSDNCRVRAVRTF